jgi:hypothetical protein
MAMNYSGYCLKESRYLSYDEIIRHAVHSVIQSYPPVIEMTKIITENGKKRKVGARERPKKYSKYDNIDQFLRLNKDCCQILDVGSGGYERSFLTRIVGDHLAIIRVKYFVYYTDHEGEERAVQVSTARSIKNCGQIW